MYILYTYTYICIFLDFCIYICEENYSRFGEIVDPSPASCQWSESVDQWQSLWATVAPCAISRLFRTVMPAASQLPSKLVQIFFFFFLNYGYSWPETTQERNFQKCNFSLDKSEIILALPPIPFGFFSLVLDIKIEVAYFTSVSWIIYHFMYNNVSIL